MLTKTGLGEALLAALGLYFCVRASSQLAGLAGATEEVFSGEFRSPFFSPSRSWVYGVCLAMALVLPYTLFLFFNTPGGPAVSYSSTAAETTESIPSNPTQP